MAGVSLENVSPEAIAEMALALKTLTDNPATRRQTLALMKTADPTLNIPEIDIQNQVNGALKEGLGRLEKLEQAMLQNEVKARVEAARKSIVDKRIVTEADIPEVEKLMVEKGIPSHETAAEFLASQRQSARPTPSSFGSPGLPNIDFKTVQGDPAKWARQEAAKVMGELIRAR